MGQLLERGKDQLMCQGCEDFREFDRLVDSLLADLGPKMLAKPLDHSVLFGAPRPSSHND